MAQLTMAQAEALRDQYLNQIWTNSTPEKIAAVQKQLNDALIAGGIPAGFAQQYVNQFQKQASDRINPEITPSSGSPQTEAALASMISNKPSNVAVGAPAQGPPLPDSTPATVSQATIDGWLKDYGGDIFFMSKGHPGYKIMANLTAKYGRPPTQGEFNQHLVEQGYIQPDYKPTPDGGATQTQPTGPLPDAQKPRVDTSVAPQPPPPAPNDPLALIQPITAKPTNAGGFNLGGALDITRTNYQIPTQEEPVIQKLAALKAAAQKDPSQQQAYESFWSNMPTSFKQKYSIEYQPQSFAEVQTHANNQPGVAGNTTQAALTGMVQPTGPNVGSYNASNYDSFTPGSIAPDPNAPENQRQSYTPAFNPANWELNGAGMYQAKDGSPTMLTADEYEQKRQDSLTPHASNASALRDPYTPPAATQATDGTTKPPTTISDKLTAVADQNIGNLTPEAMDDAVQANLRATNIPYTNEEQQWLANLNELGANPIAPEFTDIAKRQLNTMNEGLNPLEKDALLQISADQQRYGKDNSTKDIEDTIYGATEARTQRAYDKQLKDMLSSMAARGVTESGITNDQQRNMNSDLMYTLAQAAADARKYGFETDYNRSQQAIQNSMSGGAYTRDVESNNMNNYNAALNQLQGLKDKGLAANQQAAGYTYGRAQENLGRQQQAYKDAMATAQQQFNNSMSVMTGSVIPQAQIGAQATANANGLAAQTAANQANTWASLGQSIGGPFTGNASNAAKGNFGQSANQKQTSTAQAIL